VDWYKSVDEEVPNEEEQTAIEKPKKGRPPIERDEDGMRKLDFRKNKSEMWVQKGVQLLDGTVTDVFSKAGKSWWRDEKGHFRALGRYDTVEQLVEKIEDWEHLVMRKIQDGEEIIPDAESLAVGLDVSLGTLKSWQRGERGEAFKNIIDVELNKIAAVKNQLAMKGAIPSIVWMAMANNVHGYTQSNKQEITINDRREVQSADDLISRAKLLP
jgi:hypothetical protein